MIQMKQKRVAREQGTNTNQEQQQEQHLPIRHAGTPTDCAILHSFIFHCIIGTRAYNIITYNCISLANEWAIVGDNFNTSRVLF